MESSPAPNLQQVAEDALKQMRQDRSVRVTGPSGSGRTELFRSLAESGDCYPIDLLPVREKDSLVVALVEANAGLRESSFSSAALARELLEKDPKDLARGILERVRALGKYPVVRLPIDWERRSGSSDDEGGAGAYRFLLGIANSGVPLTVIADGSKESDLFAGSVTHRLKSHDVPLSQLESVDWEHLSGSFQKLLTATPRRVLATPVVWRIAVGAVALDCPPDSVAEQVVSATTPLPVLIHLVVSSLSAEQQLSSKVRKFVELRRPIAREVLNLELELSSEWSPLFVQCLGYGDANHVRSTPEVKRRLRAALEIGEESRDENTGDDLSLWHGKLARAYESLDGALSPGGLPAEQARAWCEKVHHAAHSNEHELWSKQQLLSPAQYWDRGRSLSERGLHEQAAQVYLSCTDHFPADGYSWHYLGYNLAEANAQAATVEQAYRRALKFGPERLWWNGRLVTLLIETNQFAKARDEWRRVMKRIDPDGERAWTDSAMSEQLHRWVAKAWLEAKLPKDAQQVLSELPTTGLSTDMLKLQEQVAKAVKEYRPPVDQRVDALALVCREDPGVAVASIVQTVQEWLDEGAYQSLEAFLRALADQDPSARIVFASLTATLPVENRLESSRAAVAKKVLEQTSEPEALRRLKGLFLTSEF